jgi:lipopolysaccharide export system protein LptA
MVITAKELFAYLTPKTDSNSDQSSLDHAIADGSVTISDVIGPNRTRTGIADHCEYFTANSKVVLNGGSPQLVDSYKGITKGRQLTYFDDEDHMVVEGEKKQLAFTQMKRK